MNADDDRRLKS